MGRISRLGFVQRCKDLKGDVSAIADFWRLDEHALPETGGAYVLIADNWFVYPSGSSPVFYIGQSRNLRSRLNLHLRHSRGARDGQIHERSLYWPRYEYAGKFGKEYAYVRTHRGMTPRAVEEELIASFSKMYRSFPVANGSGSWNRVAKHYDL